MKWFVDGGSDTEIDGKTWETLDISHSTRDSSTVHGKIDYLVAVMEQYFREVRRHHGKRGDQTPRSIYIRKRGHDMYTVSDIISDINRGCMANNMVEDMFRYRIVFFVNEGNKSAKYYMDTAYNGLRKSLESIIRANLLLTNCVVIAETTAIKHGKCVFLQKRSYSFSLDGYF